VGIFTHEIRQALARPVTLPLPLPSAPTLPETLFAPWETFYVIVGSSGGALTGLLFVVVALVTEKVGTNPSRGLGAYTTPSVFHFVNVLAIAALVTMPRRGLASLGVLLIACAIIGAVVTVIAVRRISSFDQYAPVAEDWISHGVVPGLCYSALLVSGIVLASATELALYLIAFSTLALLFVGIHNAWDVALYSAINMPKRPDASG
jgi:hypothetical protein